MNFKSFCLLLTVLLLGVSLCGCALLGFSDTSSNASLPSDTSRETSTTTNVGDDLAWPKDNNLANLVPEFTAGKTTEIIENDLYVRCKITGVTKKDFSDYVSKLIKAGYEKTIYTADTLFSAVKGTNNELGVVVYLTDTTLTLEVAKEIPPQVSTESLPDGSSGDSSIADESNFDELSGDTSISDESENEATDESFENEGSDLTSEEAAE